MKKIIFFFLLFNILFCIPVSAEQSNYEILVVTSHHPDNKQVDDIISSINLNLKSCNVRCSFVIKNMNVGSIANANTWGNRLHSILHESLNKKTSAIILIGQEAWTTSLSEDNLPTDIPIFTVNASHEGLLISKKKQPNSIYFSSKRVDMVKVASLAHSRYGGVLRNYDIKKNIELISNLFPNVEEIALVVDNTYGGIAIKVQTMELEQLYPSIKFKYIDASLGADRAKQMVDSIDVAKSAILLATWKVDGNNAIMMRNSLDDVLGEECKIPVFSLTGLGFGTNKNVIGGYSPDYKNDGGIIAKQILSKDSVKFVYTENHYRFNREQLKKFSIEEYTLPKESIIISSTDKELIKYRQYTLWALSLVLIIFIALLCTITLLLKNMKLRREMQLQSDALRRAKIKAEESDKLKSAFLANMSHEIRTPLNAIVGFSELLPSTTDEAEKAEYIDIIKMNNELLLRLIGDILDLSRLEAGMVEINPVQFEILKVLNDSYTYWYRRFADKGVKFEFKTYCKACNVCLDEKIVLQVINNFLTNAYKFTSAGEVTLIFEAEKEGIKISVKDTGIGIKEELQNTVFGRFAKLNKFAQGTGLGLSICKVLMELCGGEIGFTSKEGAGSTFWVYFPTKVTFEERNSVERDNTISLNRESQISGRKKILIAEDNDSNYILEEAILKKRYELVRATNGEIALTLFAQNEFDIILMDIRMPVMDGLTAIKKIREYNQNIPIVAVTANAFESDVAEAMSAGCNGFISKPLNKDRLITEIEKLTLTLTT